MQSENGLFGAMMLQSAVTSQRGYNLENGIIKMSINIEWHRQSSLVLSFTIFIVFLPNKSSIPFICILILCTRVCVRASAPMPVCARERYPGVLVR